ncbi:hypothetical protein HML84_14040 [Alcanivorax sp. IO_7]|nr:hypothetical protein HML84_14040 [Alcanivorax sp. IO_7]
MTSWKHSARALAWVAILACGFIQPRYAGAIDLNLGLSYGFDARVEAGLDAPTRRLIERLPEKVRIETLKLLREALPWWIKVSIPIWIGRNASSTPAWYPPDVPRRGP